MLKGIDISSHNRDINFSKVKNSGIQFVMIRSSYGWFNEDKKFKDNAKGCEAVGLPYGIYHYSYARSLEEARIEVEGLIRLIKSFNPTYPIVIDMEDADNFKSTWKVSNKTCVDICEYFCLKLEEAGYYAMIYANKNWFNTKINDKRLNRFDKWLAQWTDKPSYSGNFGIWQYTSKGIVNGIVGNVDMNIAYKDYSQIIKGFKKPVEQKKEEKVVVTSATPYIIKRDIKGYVTSKNAKDRKYANTTVKKGVYAIFNKVDDMINVTAKPRNTRFLD